MSSAARRIRRNASRLGITICSVSTPARPCAEPVAYTVRIAIDTCGHGAPPMPVCHRHAYTFQQQGRDPDLQPCPACRALGHATVVHITASP